MDDDEFLASAEAAIKLLQHIPAADYWMSRLPCPTDTQISDVCVLYMAATPTQRQVFASVLDQRACGRLGDFAARMAMLSVQQQSETSLFHGLVALIMELDWPDLPDVREILMTLSIVYHSAAKLGCAETLFQQAAEYADKPASRDIVLNYLKRTPQDKRIEAMGWHEIDGPNGLIYQFGKQPIPEGLL